MKNTTLGYIEFEDKYLMLYRSVDKNDGSLGKWLGIGGKLEVGESADECFIREVCEETGIKLNANQIKRRGIVDFKSESYESERMFLYTAHVESSSYSTCNEGQLKWIEKDNILDLPLWEGDHVFLEKLLNDETFFVLSLIYAGKTGDELREIIDEKLILSDVDSFDENQELYMYRDLNENQLRRVFEPELGVFIAETPVVISRAIECGYAPLNFLCEHHQLFEVCRYNHFEAPLFSASESLLTKLTGYGMTHGMLCVMQRKPLPSLNDLLQSNPRRIAVLEDVMNPTNCGAIIRSAAALGVDAMIFTKGACDPLYRRSIRVSMGNIFDMPYTIVDGYDWIEALKINGIKIISMALCDNTISLDDTSIDSYKKEKLAICFGTESTGISQALLDKSDVIIKIPMSKNVDSLNVAAASAVAFWGLR